MRLLLLFVIALSASAQEVSGSCSKLGDEVVRDLLGKRIAKLHSVWVVAIENTSAEHVQVSESAILRKVMVIRPIDQALIGMKIRGGIPRSPWTVAGNAAEDLGKIGAVVMADNSISVPSAVLIGATQAAVYAPIIMARIRGAAPPTSASFDAIAFTAPVTLAPGGSATVHIFSAHQSEDTACPVFSIPTANLPSVRTAQ